MHGMICDYCRAASESAVGWFAVARITEPKSMFESDEQYRERVGPDDGHPLKGTAHLCSEPCVRGFVTNGFRPAALAVDL